MIIYVVKPGDTIYSIAAAYGQNPEKIISENELTAPNRLVVGQTIVITGSDEQKLRTIAVNGYVYPYVSDEALSRTLPQTTFVTIFTYGFTEYGELVKIDDQRVIEASNDLGAKPFMLISTLTDEGNFSNQLANTLLNDTALQDVLIKNILANIREKGYFGLDIDFEFIPEADKQAYSDFVERVTQRLNAEGYPVIVALAPKTSAEQSGLLYEAHDYFELGKRANAVLVMTYEWGYTYDCK